MQPSNAEVRAGAVAKLKRAASLPRINGGRRPPMHSEGASEGEKSRDDVSSKQGDDSSKNATSDERELEEASQREEREQHEHEQEHEGPNGQPPPPQPPSPKRKRRSRSRSRSRSKDLKDLKPPKSPPPRDSSPEEKLGFLPAFDDIPVVSPMPSRPAGMPVGSRLPFAPPTAPSSPSPQGAVPTLQDLQQRLALGAGLFRSQSASRAAAMLKLTGGTPSFEPPQPAPSPKTALSRSNTVTGGEQRAAARQRMMGRLQHRVAGQTDELTTSGGEDVIVPAPPKRRKRRSRRSSGTGSGAGASAVVDDRDPPSTSPNTPLVPSSPLPYQTYPESPRLPLPTIQTREQQQPPPPPPPPVAPPSPQPEESSHEQDTEESRPTPVSLQQWTFDLGTPPAPPPRRRDVVVEDDELDESPAIIGPSLPQPPPSPPHTPPYDNPSGIAEISLNTPARAPHTSDAPSATTTGSGHVVPVMMSGDSQLSPYKQDIFPTSPFNTPLKERPRDEDEEEIVYQEGLKARRIWHEKVANGNGIEWPGGYIAEKPVIPVQGDEDDDDAVDALTTPASTHDQHSSPAHEDPRASVFTAHSPAGMSYAPPSPSSVVALSHSTATTRESADSSLGPSPALGNFPNTTGVFTRPESYTDTGTDWEGLHTDREDVHTDRETSSKRAPDGAEKTTWAKVKTFVGRSGSVSGRRSRANSTTKREEKAANRESGASGLSAKVEQAKFSEHGPPSTAPPSAWSSPGLMYSQLTQEQQRQLPMQSSSASASILSLSPTTHRGGASPVPPASPADLSKYGVDAKLMPFPGLVKLDEERKKQRSRRISASVSSPNLPRDVAGASPDAPNLNRPIETESRERKLSHQHSDSGLLQKFRTTNLDTELFPSTSNQPASPSASSSSWLPMSRKDLRKWYKANKFFNASQSPTSPISPSMISPPIQDGRFDLTVDTSAGPNVGAQKKLSDLLINQQSSDSTTDWEEGTSNTSTTPKGRGKGRLMDHDTMDLPHDPFASPQGATRVQSHQSSISSSDSIFKRDSEVEVEPVSPAHTLARPPLSVIQEPIPSNGSWTTSASQTDSSSSVPSYKPSSSPETAVCPPDRPSMVFQRLDTLLSRDPNDQTRWSFLEDPPRKLIMSSSVTQVVDSDTIRERFLFLFNDILVVAKPLVPTDKAMDRIFIVKNIIDLHTVQVITNRDEGLSSPPRHPLVQQFVREFGASADTAVASLLQRSGLEEDQVTLGKLLFNTFELDRTRLGGYLSKKARKTVLRSYLDCFGFAGVRIDYALRTFILTVRLPTESPEHALEHLLNTFASRWFDANARLVSFDKDLATKLVRIIVHLDNQVHRSAGGQPPMNGYGLRDFRAEWETMVRALDPRGLLPDELIHDIYSSLRRDPLRWAADPQFGRMHYSILFKRPPPNHLAYRVQSDPITLRIPHPDPDLRIRLLSQEGLLFDPPELSFTRSTEVAFRVTGTSLGPKSIIFSLMGPNAALYNGIPFSKTVMVERHFMRNTFQVAFDDQRGMKRRYMFSAEDALVCHQWALSLRQPRPAKLPRDPDSEAARQVQKAAKALSLDILREVVAQKLSGNDLIVICKQNSLIPAVLPTVTTVSRLHLSVPHAF